MLFILFLVGASSYLDRSIISVLLEPIRAEFQVSDTMLGLLTGLSFALLYATLGIPVARLAEWWDRRKILAIAVLLWSAMTALCGLAQNFTQLLMARFGVGAGESGTVPPAHSLITDYFPVNQRATALAVFSASGVVGTVLGFILGAHLTEEYGWRFALIAVGAPGAVLALLAYTLLDEPRSRRPQDNPEDRESTLAAFRVLAGKRSYIRLVGGMVAFFMLSFGSLAFAPSYLIRVLEIDLKTVGSIYGAVAAFGSLPGLVLGGVLSDRFSKRDKRWLFWTASVAMLISFPVYLIGFSVPNFSLFIALSALGATLLNVCVPPMYAALHEICGSQRRSTAVAVLFFFANLLGMGLGPVIAGALSDAFTMSFGNEGLRYAIMTSFTFALPAAWLLYQGGRLMVQDIEP
ncbi:MFS transporter [Pseudohaliea sp.]|uniref:spinster family MFS transporter n=1 Tax=Pseudohaliea sp. TaxID=2740289 RepID=UPI0032F029B3